MDSAVAQGGGLGIFVGILSHDGILSVHVLYDDFQCLVVNVECQGLFRDFLHRVEQCACRDGYASVAVAFRHFDGGHHRGFGVRCGDGERPTLEIEEETVKDGECIFRINDAANRLQMTEKSCAGNDKFHTSVYL